MPICTNCGEQNPDGISRCVKCGIGLGHQIRAQSDAKRGQVASGVRIVVWIAVVVAVAAVSPAAYHAAGTAYYKHHLKSMFDRAMSDCGGPITETTQQYQKDQINHCLSGKEELKQAQADYDSFTNAKGH